MRFAVLNPGRARLSLAVWLCGVLGSPALGAGLGSEYAELVNPRTFEESTYRIRVPDVVEPGYRIPVVVILHDAGKNGGAIIDDERLVEAFVGKGYAVLAPDALPRRNVRIRYRGKKPGPLELEDFTLPFSYSKKKFIMTDSDGTIRVMRWRTDSGWYFYNIDRVRYSRGENVGSQPIVKRLGRDEIQNLRNVLRNAEEEYGIDPKPVLIIGLGHGGSLVWQIACYAPELGQILAPVGGSFWREIPKNCTSRANLVHTHQRESAFWPLEGGRGSKRRYARTSIFSNLDMLIRDNQCGLYTTMDRNNVLGVTHTTWADCREGGPVELMLLDDAFDFQTWWLDEMLDRIALTDADRPPEAPEVPVETGPMVKAPGAGTGFKTPGAGTEFKTPGAGTGFKTPDTGTGSRFKRAK